MAIVGHLDRGAALWNRGGRYFGEDAPWYRAAVEGALRALAAAGTIVELSTGGWHYGLDQPFPSPWIARRCRDLGIPMTPSGDTHRARWDRTLIVEGHDLVRRCLRRNAPGPYQVQAAINAMHTDAATAADTD